MDSTIKLPSRKRLSFITSAYLLLFLFLSVISAFAVSLGVSFFRLIFQKLNYLNLQPSDNVFWFSLYFFSELMLLLTTWLCFHFSIQNKQVFEKLNSHKYRVVLVGIAGGVFLFGVSILSSYLTKVIYGDLKDPIIERFLFFSPTYRISFAILASLIAPICEEMLFRRALFGVFRQYGYITTGIIFSSLLFAVIHFSVFMVMGVFYFAVIFMAGIILAIVYHKTNSILTSIISHILVNTFSFLLYFYWFT